MNRKLICFLVAVFPIWMFAKSGLFANDSSNLTAKPNILWIVGENLKLDLGVMGLRMFEPRT